MLLLCVFIKTNLIILLTFMVVILTLFYPDLGFSGELCKVLVLCHQTQRVWMIPMSSYRIALWEEKGTVNKTTCVN